MNFPPPFRSLHSSLFIAFQYLPSPFLTFHRLSLPFIAFRRLSLPFIAFHYLSSPPHLIVRPLSAPPFCPRLSPLSHHAPFYPHLAPFRPRLAPFCPHLAQLSRHAPAFPRFTHLLPSCFITPLCFTSSPFALLSPIVLHPFFYSPAPPQTRPRNRKRQRFSHFSKKFCKKPLTKQKKVLY